MKKLTLIGLCLSLPFFVFAEHDFAYYKAKTIEMLPVLNIDPAMVSFASINKTPTIQEYMAHPQAIFINSSFLNTKLEQDALFECAVQAQLSQARAIKGNMNNVLCALLCLMLSGILLWSPRRGLSISGIPEIQLPSRLLPKPCRSFCFPAKFHMKYRQYIRPNW